MTEKTALTVSVGVWGAISTWLTATILPLPVWVVFIAWACAFLVGSGIRGAALSALANLVGIAVATVTLLLITAAGGSTLILGIGVGLGSALMIGLSRLPVLAAAPAIVIGFAITVATMVATDVPVTRVGVDHPALVAAGAVLTGAVFAVLSGRTAALLTTRRREPDAVGEATA
ncbi:MAG: DUF1097 domain-containing protein [Pseudonocardia sp.]|uniref:DUF1097 domain-containing protein n=1 Tax=unclassified Pseudonocardia TaxID=2619320 RepID=UPI00086DFB3F|nr:MULTISPECIES: DUF1097 domain-containing protein [unclassified Pseudonocardia]MBN9107190.1 DUF1097 domain-containing protein [Pseudonocardia sp.]ODU26946.1 MAG: hypothetical protein ABS80_04970 [Pseudonocardia sp. SCN 72-51]ODV05307.1 MAG: hypothetical protein ABT15_17555 [Pseudonocardia sp. SCN 73-27]